MNTTTSRIALVMLLVGCGSSTKPPADRAARHGVHVASPDGLGSLSGDSVPRFFPNYVTPCKATEFKRVMKDDLNASLTRISDALFHAKGESDAGLEPIADAAGEILGCAVTIRGRAARMMPRSAAICSISVPVIPGMS